MINRQTGLDDSNFLGFPEARIGGGDGCPRKGLPVVWLRKKEHNRNMRQRQLPRLTGIIRETLLAQSTFCAVISLSGQNRQSPFAQRVHPSIMWAKLRSLAEGAKIATAELWGKRSAA